MKYVLIFLLVFSAASFALIYDEDPIQDTWIWPGNGPYGSSTELRTNIVSSYDQEILAEWDITSIPVGSTINSADMSFYRYDGMGDLDCDLFRITEAWDEDTLVNAIGHDTGTIYDQISIAGSGWYTFDVSTLVQEWVDETYDNYGVVWYGTAGSGYFQRIYSLDNGSNVPNLEIDYDEPQGIESASFGEIKAVFK